MDFCTMGMFIIDDIYPAPGSASHMPQLGVPGGAGTYSALGARVLSPSPESRGVGWIVDCGTDFPPNLRDTLLRWDTGVLLRDRQGLTTRGWNGYTVNDHRDFKYLTPKLRLEENDLSDELLTAKSIHMVCSQERCASLVAGITRRRMTLDDGIARPVFVYEPSPDCAIPERLTATLDILCFVDVISPNHEELANMFGSSDQLQSGTFNHTIIEEYAAQMLQHATEREHRLIVMVRAGREGSYTATNGPTPVSIWLPPYWQDQGRVVDPTGGGNGFLGGFAVGLVRTGDVVEASCWGHVSASFCIEQVGIPVFSKSEEELETWNGIVAQDRLNEYRSRVLKSSRRGSL